MIGLLLALYPAPWRRRYGEEFRAVLESRPLGPFDVADVLIGALDARLSGRGRSVTTATDGGHVVMLRLGGFGAIAGGILWFVALLASNVVDGVGSIWMWLAAVGTLGLLVAVVGLSAFQAYREPRLAWAAFAVPALGLLLSVIGLVRIAIGPGDSPHLVGPLDAWSVWIIGLMTTLVGSLVFAVATIRANVLSRPAAIGLGVSSVAILLVAFGTWDIDTESLAAQLIFIVAFGSFTASWVGLGATALRRGPIRAIAPA